MGTVKRLKPSSKELEGVINLKGVKLKKWKTDAKKQGEILHEADKEFDSLHKNVHKKKEKKREEFMKKRDINLPEYLQKNTKNRLSNIYQLANISYQDKKKRNDIIKDTNYKKNITIYSDDKNHVMKNPKTKLINWSIRGTDKYDTGDLKNDLHILSALAVSTEDDKRKKTTAGKHLDFLNHDRLQKTHQIYKNLKKEYPDHRINISGHSLAGFLGKDLLHTYSDDKLKVYGINSAPHHHFNLNDERYHSLRNKDDLVSRFEGASYHKNPNAVQLDTYQNPLSAHGLGNWEKLDIKHLHKPHNILHSGL